MEPTLLQPNIPLMIGTYAAVLFVPALLLFIVWRLLRGFQHIVTAIEQIARNTRPGGA